MAETIKTNERRKALIASIRHWLDNCIAQTPEEFSVGEKACALCLAYADCVGCPVAQHTGHDACVSTPYYIAHNAKIRWAEASALAAPPEVMDKLADQARKAAVDETLFLISLLGADNEVKG